MQSLKFVKKNNNNWRIIIAAYYQEIMKNSPGFAFTFFHAYTVRWVAGKNELQRRRMID